jgi:hypothetical protein
MLDLIAYLAVALGQTPPVTQLEYMPLPCPYSVTFPAAPTIASRESGGVAKAELQTADSRFTAACLTYSTNSLSAIPANENILRELLSRIAQGRGVENFTVSTPYRNRKSCGRIEGALDHRRYRIVAMFCYDQAGMLLIEAVAPSADRSGSGSRFVENVKFCAQGTPNCTKLSAR